MGRLVVEVPPALVVTVTAPAPALVGVSVTRREVPLLTVRAVAVPPL